MLTIHELSELTEDLHLAVHDLECELGKVTFTGRPGISKEQIPILVDVSTKLIALKLKCSKFISETTQE